MVSRCSLMLPELSTASTSATSTSARGVRVDRIGRHGQLLRQAPCDPGPSACQIVIAFLRQARVPLNRQPVAITDVIYTKRPAGLEAGHPQRADDEAAFARHPTSACGPHGCLKPDPLPAVDTAGMSDMAASRIRRI